MHEVALAQSIVELAEEHAKRDTFVRVRSIRLAIGALSHVDPSALEFGFEAVAKGTIAEGAVLAIDRPAGRALCAGCHETVEVHAYGDACPRCGDYRWSATGGTQMRVVDLEVE